MTLIDIYLAGPYAHEDKEIKQRRFNELTIKCAQLAMKGAVVYSPITMGHPMHLTGMVPNTWKFWREYDLVFLGLSKTLVVLKLDGWHQSRGLADEIEYAVTNRIPITYIES